MIFTKRTSAINETLTKVKDLVGFYQGYIDYELRLKVSRGLTFPQIRRLHRRIVWLSNIHMSNALIRENL